MARSGKKLAEAKIWLKPNMETLQRTANRGSVSTGDGNSLVLESDKSERLHKTPSGAGNRRTFTISFWTKRTEINGVKQYLLEAGNSDSNTDRFTLRFGTGDTFDIQSSSTWLVTNRVFRDIAAWYHFVIKVDTTDGTAANRIKLYVNGVEETSFSTDNRSSINQNHDFPVNNTEIHNIGSSPIEGGLFYNGYIAEWVQLDGTASAPTAFGEFDTDSGIWKPIDVSGLTFGTNGFYLDFEASGNLGNDANGGTDFTLVNIGAADHSTDSPTNNFATINSLAGLGMGGVPFKFPQGGTEIKRDPDDTGGWVCVVSTMAVNKGKWYAEMEVLESPSLTMYGYTTVAYYEGGSGLNYPQFYLGNSPNNTGYYSNGDGANDSIYEDVSYPSAGVQSSAGTIISIALDCDNNKIHFANNGTYTNSSNPATNANGFPVIDDYVYFAHASYTGNKIYKTNLGGYTSDAISSAASDANGYGTFEYAPPSGYYALCTKNLAEFG